MKVSSVFHVSPAAPKTEQGCESRTPPPSSRSPHRDHSAQDPLANPSGSLRFYPINSKGSRAIGSNRSSQRVTHPPKRVTRRKSSKSSEKIGFRDFATCRSFNENGLGQWDQKHGLARPIWCQAHAERLLHFLSDCHRRLSTDRRWRRLGRHRTVCYRKMGL